MHLQTGTPKMTLAPSSCNLLRGNIGFFIEARLQFDHRRYLFSIFTALINAFTIPEFLQHGIT